MPELIATLVGGACWIIVYIACIVIGFKQQTYCMPLFPLCMNLIWEFCESGTIWNLIWQEDGSFLLYSQFAVFSIWFILDVVIFITYCMYGRKYFPDLAQPYFVTWILVVFFYWCRNSFGCQYDTRRICHKLYGVGRGTFDGDTTPCYVVSTRFYRGTEFMDCSS